MKRGTLPLFAVLAAILGLIAAGASSVLHDGLSARAHPTKLEAFLAGHAWRLAVPARDRGAKNPVAATPENLRDARLHFSDHCAVCHANDGSGDAMLAHGLYPKPPDMRQAATQNRPDGELFWIIENGVRFTGMPAFSSGGSAEDSWKLVHFIRHMPHLTPEELKEMKLNNPQSAMERDEEKQEDEFMKQSPAGEKSAPPHAKH